ncbi:MAG: T9SS type A sorting domain-containing protein [Candidatus Kapabacteria bacterium]|nr:T9SS type A sorting domain-containing protein [Candidatus Kapabacteria bacterium]
MLFANQFDTINKKYNYFIYKSIDSCKTWQKQFKVYESDYNNREVVLFENKQLLFLRIQSDLYYSKENELKFNKLISPLNISSFDIENEYLGAILEYENLAEPYPEYYDYCRIYKNYSFYYDTIVFLKNPIPDKNKTKLLYQILSLKNNKWVIRSEDGFEITENNGKEWFHIEINSDSILGYSMSIRPDNFIYIYDRYKPSFNQMFITNNFKDFIRCQVPKNSNGFRTIQAVNKDIAYAVSDSGLYKTTDGGGVFTEVVEEIKESQEIKISSSKNSSFSLELKYPPSEAKLELINIMGVPLFSQSTSSQLINISLDPYPTGIYLLKYTAKHSTQVFKLLRE